VIEEENEPSPEPSMERLLPEGVGLGLVLQQTPLAVRGNPPSETTLPPETAEEMVMDEATVVASCGKPMVLKLI
jgi:hypothetical protein